MVKRKLSTKEVMDKYGAKIEAQMNSEAMKSSTNYSQEYIKFKDEIAPEFSGYEKWAHSLGKSIKIKASSKDEAKLKKAIDTAHLDIEPSQALSLSIMSFISVFFFGLILSVGVALAKGSIEEFPALLFILFVIFS